MKSALRIAAMAQDDVNMAITTLLEVAIELLDEIDQSLPAAMAHLALTSFVDAEAGLQKPYLVTTGQLSRF